MFAGRRDVAEAQGLLEDHDALGARLASSVRDGRVGACRSKAGVLVGARVDPSLFRRLVLGWIEADFRVQIRIF